MADQAIQSPVSNQVAAPVAAAEPSSAASVLTTPVVNQVPVVNSTANVTDNSGVLANNIDSINQPQHTSNANDPWYTKIKDDNLRGFAETKKFQSVEELLSSYKSMEDTGLADKANNTVILPKDANDIEGYNNLYKTLGRPNNPEDYGIVAPEGQDGTLAKEMSKEFFNAGLSKTQAELIMEKYNQQLQNTMDIEKRNFQTKADNEMREWKNSQGLNADRNIENCRRFMAAVELDGNDLSKLEKALGTKKTMDILSRAGGLTSEDSFMGPNSSNSGLLSPEGASVEIDRLIKDKDFYSQLSSGNVQAQEKWDRLIRLKGMKK